MSLLKELGCVRGKTDWQSDYLFKISELRFKIGHGSLQHLLVSRVGGAFELLAEAFTGKQQALMFPIAFLLLAGKGRTCGLGLFFALSLLLLD
jgi:hypothetical protein